MNKLFGTIKNLPGNINLRDLNSYLDDTFNTNVGFRCLTPSKVMGYPTSDIGFLIVSRKEKLVQLTYITTKATYVSGLILRDNGNRTPVAWIQKIDGRQKSIANYKSDVLYLITDKDIQDIIERYIIPFDDSELWTLIEDKITKEKANLYTTSQNPVLSRQSGMVFETTKGIWIAGNNVIAGSANVNEKNDGFHKGSRAGLIVSRSSWVSGDIMMAYASGKKTLYGNPVESEAVMKAGRVLILKSRNRPILSTFGDISADKNREIVIRADVRWKLFYNGRDGFKDVAYPAHAREVLVQMYTDVGGRIHKNRANVYWRDLRYCEFEPMHFIKGINNVVVQDTGFCYHHSDATVHVRHIGADHVINQRSYRTETKYEGDAGPGPYGAFDHFPSIRRIWWR